MLKSKPKLAAALAKRYPELQLLPRKKTSLQKLPYRGVLRGLTIEGSPQGYLWRVRLFAYLPNMALDHIVLSNVVPFDNFWWNSRTDSLDIGDMPEEFGHEKQPAFESICWLYENRYRQWLDDRASPEALLGLTPVPKASDLYSPPKWWLSGVHDAWVYCLMCIACGRLTVAQGLLDDIFAYLEKPPTNEVKERIRTLELPRLRELDSVLAMSTEDRARWLSDRDRLTFDALGMGDSSSAG
jgi:hypothetical protein